MKKKITTFLSYPSGLEDAAKLYAELFDGKITSSSKGPDGKVFSMTFELFGDEYYAMNGGSTFEFGNAVSLFVSCETQAEIDRYWDALTKDGGKSIRCGWCEDKWGVTWQIIPSDLGTMMTSPNREKANRMVAAMMQMEKLDMAKLRAAFEGT